MSNDFINHREVFLKKDNLKELIKPCCASVAVLLIKRILLLFRVCLLGRMLWYR